MIEGHRPDQGFQANRGDKLEIRVVQAPEEEPQGERADAEEELSTRKTTKKLTPFSMVSSEARAQAARPSRNDAPNKKETFLKDGRQIVIEYVQRDEIAPAFGYAWDDNVQVRSDLPLRVQNFVKAHEIYHCFDKSDFGGWIGRELRANFFPGIKDPVGLLATIWATLSNKERMHFYWQRFKKKE